MTLRFLMMGMNGAMTQATLKGLLAAGHRPVAILLPDGEPNSDPQQVPSQLAPANTPSALELLQVTTMLKAWENGIPLWVTGTVTSKVALNWLKDMEVELIIVACFPWVIPGSWLNETLYGALNVHPSILPAFRGPTPLFWQLRHGVTKTGVTIHQVSEKLDGGDILTQDSWSWEDGWREDEANWVAGLQGGKLLAELLDRPVAQWQRTPQDESLVTYQPGPTTVDLQILTSWSAQQAYNFMRGTVDWGSRWLEIDGKTVWIDRVQTWEPAGSQAAPFIWLENGVRVAFNPGIVEFVVRF